MLLTVLLIQAAADSFTMPAIQVAMALAGPPDQVSSGQGLLGATGLATAGVAGLAAGYLYEQAGRATLFAVTAAVMATCLLVANADRAGPPVPDAQTT
jgi:hypothetical protein